MELSKDNLAQLADRSLGQRPLVMPNLSASKFVAEQLGKPIAPVKDGLAAVDVVNRDCTVEEQLAFAQRYNYVPDIVVYWSPFVLTAARWCEHLKWQEQSVEDEAAIEQTRTLKTPHGQLCERTRYHKKEQLTQHLEEMIKDAEDIKALAWIIHESARVIDEHREDIKQAVLADIVPKIKHIKGQGLSIIHFWSPLTEVVYPHFSQVTLHYFLHDYPELARELMDEVLDYNLLQVEIAIEAQVDAMQTALWGYDQFSPKIYDNYIIPYIKPISDNTRAGGALFWVHTCGHMKGLLEQKMYHRFGVDILECLNYPPAGDVDDWPRLRRLVPEGTITKGNLEDSLLWQGPIAEIKRKTHEILVESEGCKHILATANNIFDGTPRAHFEAMLEAVDEYSEERGLA